MAELNVVILQNEIRKLKISEQMKRREYAQMQDNVQDTWDKLVNLRSHIALFNSAIEEVRIEEATYYANSSLSSMDSNDLTSDMATRLSSLHALREKVRLKEGLKAKVTLMEEQLIVLRKKLSDQAEYLSKTSNSMIADASGSASKETLVTLNEHRLEDSMSARTALLISSRKLEDFESEYLQNVSELELVELEISEVMKWNPDLEKEASSNTDDLSPPKTPPRTSKDIPMTPSTYCPISLHEVLSGQARVTRINGEDASKYRVRLEKRVAGLKILDEQLNKELNQKNADLLKIKSLLKDVELQRLRKEVELNNLEKHIEDAVSGVDISSPLPDSAVELENVTESPLKKSQSEKNINMAIQMLGQDLMQNVVMPSSIKRTSDSTNMNVTVGFEGDGPFTPCTNVSDTKEQTSPADVSMRLEKLAKNLEDSSELAVGQKELLQTVQKQQKDLETLRVAQANLLKLITGKELSQSGITELSDCASPETDSDPRTIPNTSSSAALMLNDSISSISMPVAHENEGAGDLRRNSPGAQSPAHVSTTEIYQELQSTLAVDKTVSDAFKTPIKEMLVAKKPCPINTTPREAATSGVSLPILDDETASILVFDNTYMNLLRKVNNCREKLTEAQAKEFIDKHTGTVFDPITAKSTSFVEVGVISARELPITKKFNNSSDPFIELFLVKKHETSSSSPSVGIQNNRTFSTKVLHTNIRPQWRETFKFTELLPPCTESADTAEDENPLEELLLFLLLMDHNKSAAPEIVGECSVSLKDFLDQEKHTVWINVKPPVVGYRQRTKIPENCAIKVEIRVSYNKQKLWSHRYEGVVGELKKFIEDFKHQRILEKKKEEAKKKKAVLQQQQQEVMNATRKLTSTVREVVSAGKNSKEFTTYKSGDQAMKSTSLKRINALVHSSSAVPVKAKQQKTSQSPVHAVQKSTPQRVGGSSTKAPVKASPFPISKSIGNNSLKFSSQVKTPVASATKPLYRIGGARTQKTASISAPPVMHAISPTRYPNSSVDPHNIRTSVSPERFKSPLSSLSTSPTSPAVRSDPKLSIFKRSGAAGYDHASGTYLQGAFLEKKDAKGENGLGSGANSTGSPSSPQQSKNFKDTSSPMKQLYSSVHSGASTESLEDNTMAVPVRPSRPTYSGINTLSDIKSSGDSVESQKAVLYPQTPPMTRSSTPNRGSPGTKSSGTSPSVSATRDPSPQLPLHVAYSKSPHKNGVKIVSEPSLVSSMKVPLHRNVQHVRRGSINDEDDDDGPANESNVEDEYECY